MAVEAATRASPAWEVASEAARPEAVDPLLSCLVALTKLFERPYSPEALRAGLPLDDGRLTPALFLRAAARAGLTGKIVRRALPDISAFVLPALLLLDQRDACVLLRVRDDGMAEVLLPETGEGVHEVAFDTLVHRYSGHAIFVRPEYRYDGRPIEAVQSPGQAPLPALVCRARPAFGHLDPIRASPLRLSGVSFRFVELLAPQRDIA